MEPIRLSVRKMVELVLRCGDIDSRYVDSSVMQDGAKAHRKLQSGMGSGYKKEVSLRINAESGGVPVIVFGRADGIITEEDGSLTIDEIKSTTLPLDRLADQRELHLGQAKCYAHMLAASMEEKPAAISIQLTYHQLETEETRRERVSFSTAGLAGFFESLLEGYGVWLRFEGDWRELRQAAIKGLPFPFPAYRKGQREMAVAVYRSIEKRRKLYAQAPTGIGKTLSSLFPAIKAMGEGLSGRIFYLTAKTVTRAVAEDALYRMEKKGLRLKSITIRAKDKICFMEETVCNPEHCFYAKGHYDRVNAAILDLLGSHDRITSDVVEEFSRRHSTCPYETQLDAALWADAVICDYNYVFDPVVYLRRFFGDGAEHDYVFLIDEAHNLGERVRDMYTAVLDKRSILAVKSALKDKNAAAKKLNASLTSLNKYFLDEGRECGEHLSRVRDEADAVLLMLVQRFTAAAEEWLAQERHSGHPLHMAVLELYFKAGFFAGIADIYDERYRAITELDKNNVIITLFCLDPSKIVEKKLGMARASTLFSATLTPLPYYREMLGGTEGDAMLSLPSPFDQDRLLLAAHGGISTKYIDRPDSCEPIADSIACAISRKIGNYLVFFPSYSYMNQVYELFTRAYPDYNTLLQTGNMDEEARAGFLANFDAPNRDGLVGFCVMGGIFSEGIDLAGDRLIGSIIIGVGLPGISLRQDLIREYFDIKQADGYDYAYVYPGMNKVLQAAGRVIRSEEDYGIVLLIDNRFHTAKYRRLYPGFWGNIQMIRHIEELELLLDTFPYFE